MDDFVYFTEESDYLDEEEACEFGESSDEMWQRMFKRKRDRQWSKDAEHFNRLAAIKKVDSIMRFRAAQSCLLMTHVPSGSIRLWGSIDSDVRT